MSNSTSRIRQYSITQADLGDLTFGRKILVNVPDDAQLVAVHTPQDRYDMLHLLFYHPSFDEIWPGDCYYIYAAKLGVMTLSKENLETALAALEESK